MSWDYDFAQELKALKSTQAGAPLLEGSIVSKQPLTISLYGGEVMAPPLPLRLTATAAAIKWEPGQSALCAMMGKTLVVIDRM